jgi:hypothetical protein
VKRAAQRRRDLKLDELEDPIDDLTSVDHDED